MRFSLFALAMICGALPAWSDEVNIYSHRQPDLIEPLMAAFTAETGIAVNIAFVDKGMAERLVAEGDRSPADLILTVDIARLTEIVAAGVTQPVDSAVLSANVPAQYRDPGNEWFALTTRARIIYASKDRVAAGEVTTYEDLASDKWKGRICTRSGTNDYNVALTSAILAHHDALYTTNWLQGVKANLARKPEGGDRDQVKAIWAGECDIAVGNTYYIGQMLADPEQAKAANAVSVVFPVFENGGTHMNVSGIAMTRAAPNREAAQKLMEWLASDAAQQIYAETNHEFPVKSGVAMSPLLQSWSNFSPDSLSLSDLAALRPQALSLIETVDFDG